MANNGSRLLKTKTNKVTSPFGLRTITYTSGPAKGQTVTKNHNGIDIVGVGNTLDDIVAHTAGTVTSAGFDSACGYYVQIQTASGAIMAYYHMARGSLKVKNGDSVKQGQVLGYMGATGNVTGAHLHFGISVNGKWIDPAPYINADYEKEGNKVTVTLPILKQGSKDDAVKALQILLNGYGFSCGKVDGSFGPDTLAAVKAFQKARGLAVDGSVGPATWAALLWQKK